LKKILYFIQLPPPVHGVSLINEFIYNNERLNKHFSKELIKIDFSNSIGDLKKVSIKKAFVYLRLIYRVINRLIVFKPKYIYFTIVPTGSGFIKDLPFVFIFKLLRVRTILHFHGKGIEEASKSIYLKVIYNWVLKNNIVIHLSRNLMLREFKNLKLENTDIYIAENGVKNQPLHSSNRKDKEEIIILFLSNLHPSKGLFVLLESFLLLRTPKNKRLKLQLIGCMPNYKIENKINEYKAKCNNAIELVGPKYDSDKYLYLTNADIFILPTLNDAFPLVILEAMQAKLPIISTYQGAIPEILVDNESGFLVVENDVNELTRRTQLLVDNEQLRYKLSKNAYSRYLEKYTLDRFENTMAGIFNQLA
jgi:glycosyltransferase involved in cell wall biosynthesis